MVSSMTLEKLLPYCIAYQRSPTGQEIGSDTALEQLIDFVTGKEDFEELSDKPRINLCSEDWTFYI